MTHPTLTPSRTRRPHRQALSTLLCSLALLMPGAAQTMTLVLLEEQYAQGPIINDFRVHDALADEEKPYLRIYPDKNEVHKQFVEILSAGMPFDAPNVRNQVAEVLQGFPDVCKPHMGVAMVVGPIGHIDRVVLGVKDKRRILHMYIGNCLREDLPECEYDITRTGSINFDIGMFITVLRQCRDATNLALRNQAAFADWTKPTETPATPAPEPGAEESSAEKEAP